MTMILDGTNGITYPVATATGSATQASASRVLQVVNATYSTQASTTSSTYADTGLTASITPSSSTSKILITVDCADCANAYTNGSLLGLQLIRGGTSLIVFAGYAGFMTAGSYTMDFGSCSTTYLDSPATTSSTTYKVQIRSTNNTGTMYMNYTGNSVSTITLMEISA